MPKESSVHGKRILSSFQRNPTVNSCEGVLSPLQRKLQNMYCIRDPQFLLKGSSNYFQMDLQFMSRGSSVLAKQIFSYCIQLRGKESSVRFNLQCHNILFNMKDTSMLDPQISFDTPHPLLRMIDSAGMHWPCKEHNLCQMQ